VPKTSGHALISSIGNQTKIENLQVIEFCMIDSRAVDLKFLHGLSQLVQTHVDDENVDGVVVIHGTDTMEITAYFLHRSVATSRKPVVITGAMRVVSNSDYDG